MRRRRRSSRSGIGRIPEKIHPVSHTENRFRRAWGLDGKFVVEYSGNLGVPHSFADILAVAEELSDHDELRFLFVGGGARFKEVEKAVASKGLGNVVMKPYQDASDLSDTLSVGMFILYPFGMDSKDWSCRAKRTGSWRRVVPSSTKAIGRAKSRR